MHVGSNLNCDLCLVTCPPHLVAFWLLWKQQIINFFHKRNNLVHLQRRLDKICCLRWLILLPVTTQTLYIIMSRQYKTFFLPCGGLVNVAAALGPEVFLGWCYFNKWAECLFRKSWLNLVTSKKAHNMENWKVLLQTRQAQLIIKDCKIPNNNNNNNTIKEV